MQRLKLTKRKVLVNSLPCSLAAPSVPRALSDTVVMIVRNGFCQ